MCTEAVAVVRAVESYRVCTEAVAVGADFFLDRWHMRRFQLRTL
jgi:hypothetical protein